VPLGPPPTQLPAVQLPKDPARPSPHISPVRLILRTEQGRLGKARAVLGTSRWSRPNWSGELRSARAAIECSLDSCPRGEGQAPAEATNIGEGLEWITNNSAVSSTSLIHARHQTSAALVLNRKWERAGPTKLPHNGPAVDASNKRGNLRAGRAAIGRHGIWAS